MNKRPIIIDTDPGVDDFFCLMMAKAFEDVFDIRALSIICGNNTQQVCTQNALDIGKILGLETKIASGADHYLMEPYGEPVISAHGHNGVGEAILPHSDQKPEEKYAWDVIYDEAVACGGELELVPVGPLTNIAIAILKYPALKNLIKHITIMGGSSLVGNMSPYGEANVAHDAHAADIVFKSGIPITMVGLNVTSQCPVGWDKAQDYVKNAPQVLQDAVKTMLEFRAGEALHDAVAVGLMVRPQMGTFENHYVKIETSSPLTMGQTVVDFASTKGKKANVSVAMDIDSDAYTQLFCEMLSRF